MTHEKALCDALIRLLEDDIGSERVDISYPEIDYSGPRVEMRLRIGNRRIAIEHTFIEPFPKAIQTGKEFVELTSALESDLAGAMPKPGTYVLTFPVHPTDGHHRDTHNALRNKMREWILTAAEEMRAEYPERKSRYDFGNHYRETRRAEIDGIPLELARRVDWSESGHRDGSLFLARAAGTDVEAQRVVRIATALDKKLPKLRDCAKLGDTTFLILEWSDISLSNEVVISNALETALAERDDWPDHIFLADTTLEQWYFYIPVRDGRYALDTNHIEIEPIEAADGD